LPPPSIPRLAAVAKPAFTFRCRSARSIVPSILIDWRHEIVTIIVTAANS